MQKDCIILLVSDFSYSVISGPMDEMHRGNREAQSTNDNAGLEH